MQDTAQVLCICGQNIRSTPENYRNPHPVTSFRIPRWKMLLRTSANVVVSVGRQVRGLESSHRRSTSLSGSPPFAVASFLEDVVHCCFSHNESKSIKDKQTKDRFYIFTGVISMSMEYQKTLNTIHLARFHCKPKTMTDWGFILQFRTCFISNCFLYNPLLRPLQMDPNPTPSFSLSTADS